MKIKFRNKFQNNLLCALCQLKDDNQAHILECELLSSKLKSDEENMAKVDYPDIFSDIHKQKQATHLFVQLIKIRNKLVDNNLCKIRCPNTSVDVLEFSDNLQDCIVRYSSGILGF